MREVAKFATGHTIVVEKSTLPVKTAEVIKKIWRHLNQKQQSKKNISCFVQSRILSRGSAVKDLEEPDKF